MRLHVHLLASLTGFRRSAHPVLAAPGAPRLDGAPAPSAPDGVISGGGGPGDALSLRRQLAATCEEGVVECTGGFVPVSPGSSIPSSTSCEVACNGNCCIGDRACAAFSGTVCRDGSCDGELACYQVGYGGGSVGLIGGSDGTVTGPSCVARQACTLLGAHPGTVEYISGNSCVGGYQACYRLAYGSGSNVESVSGASCNGTYACSVLGDGRGTVGPISGNSCIGNSACYRLGRSYGTVGSVTGASCNGERVCEAVGMDGGTVESVSGASCDGSDACRVLGRHGTVGPISDASCKGERACNLLGYHGTVGSITSASCGGTDACYELGREGNVSSINNCCQSDNECQHDKTDEDVPPKCFLNDGPIASPITAGPTGSPTTSGPTGAPTTSGPTGAPTTAAPTYTPWTIDFIGIISDFSSSSGDEVVMTYEIGKNRTHETFLYERDCASSIKDLTVNTTEVKTNINETHDLLTLRHSVDKSAIANSTTWDPATNKFKFCQFVRLIVPEAIGQLEMEIATNYHEVVIDFDLSANFDIENELGAGTIEEAAGETNVSSYVDACKCNGPDNFTCEPDALVPNTQLHVCIKSVSTDVQVKELKSMVVVQGDSVLNIILGGLVQLSSIASMTYVKAQNGVAVSTFVPTNMFNYSAGTSINITGGIDMELAGSRRLLARVLDGDTLGADGDDQEFELKVDLKEEVIVLEGEGGWMDSSGAVLGGASALLGVALLIAYGFW